MINGPSLDIIMPHYKEPWDTVKKFFAMLELQRGIDFHSFRVLIVNDGKENAFPLNQFSSFPYEVLQISITHAGVSAARNAGLLASEAEWVMFCDCDDMFAHPYALLDIHIVNIVLAGHKDGGKNGMKICHILFCVKFWIRVIFHGQISPFTSRLFSHFVTETDSSRSPALMNADLRLLSLIFFSVS